MSASVALDQKGVFGPAVTLLFQPPINEASLNEASKLLKTNYLHLSIDHIKASHRREFCAFLLQRFEQQKPVTPALIIKTGFFQKMQCKQISPLHDRVKNILVPAMLLQYAPTVPAAGNTYPNQDNINEWLTCFLESYQSQDQLENHCNYHEKFGNNPEIKSERERIGYALYTAFQFGGLTQKDLNSLLKGTGSDPHEYLSQADHPDVVEDFANQYLKFFALAQECSEILSEIVRSSLDTSFRQKMFPKAS